MIPFFAPDRGTLYNPDHRKLLCDTLNFRSRARSIQAFRTPGDPKAPTPEDLGTSEDGPETEDPEHLTVARSLGRIETQGQASGTDDTKEPIGKGLGKIIGSVIDAI